MQRGDWTPLHLAVEDNHADLSSWLCEAKADVNLKELRKGRTALYFACWNANEKVLRALVHAGADVKARNVYQETPLHYVAVCRVACGMMSVDKTSSVART